MSTQYYISVETMSRIKLLLLIGLITISFIGVVQAHDWYPMACCSGQDCHPVLCSELVDEAKGGVAWGQFHFNSSQVHITQDAQCHVCIHKYFTYDHIEQPICVFTNPGS